MNKPRLEPEIEKLVCRASHHSMELLEALVSLYREAKWEGNSEALVRARGALTLVLLHRTDAVLSNKEEAIP